VALLGLLHLLQCHRLAALNRRSQLGQKVNRGLASSTPAAAARMRAAVSAICAPRASAAAGAEAAVTGGGATSCLTV
jgi:hypothetical protein